jgi:hypothetical protein
MVRGPLAGDTCIRMDDEDAVALEPDDFRRERKYLAPHVFALSKGDDSYPDPFDLVNRDVWAEVMDLPTDVALKSTSYEGSVVSDMHRLQSDWIFAMPPIGQAPYMEEVSLLAAEEFDALVFNAAHGWYRQAMGCLRNALESMIVAAALSVASKKASFEAWRRGEKEYKFGNVREMLRDSMIGLGVDADVAPNSVFGDDASPWAKARYARLCAYAHSKAGYNNADFWESNGPIFVPPILGLVEAELRETLALCYLLLRIGWSGYKPAEGANNLLNGPGGNWFIYLPMLRSRLL